MVSLAQASPQTQAQGQAEGVSQRPHSASSERSGNPRLDLPPCGSPPPPGSQSLGRSLPPPGPQRQVLHST